MRELEQKDYNNLVLALNSAVENVDIYCARLRNDLCELIRRVNDLESQLETKLSRDE